MTDKKKLNILFVANTFFPVVGGLENSIDQSIKKLSAEGNRVFLLLKSPRNGKRNKSAFLSYVKVNGFFDYHAAFKAIDEIILSNSIDIINVNNLDSFLSFVAARVAKKKNIPIVLTQHSMIGPKLWLPAKCVAQFYQRYIAVSSVIAEQLKKLNKKAKTYIINNRYSDDILVNASRQKVKTIITVSRLTRRKNVGEFIELAKKIHLYADAVRFVIVGGGPQQAALQRKITQLGLSDVVRITGFVDQKTVFSYLQQADLFVATCKLEGFGMAALEACASGLPVIAYQGTGVKDFINHGGNGFLLQTQDEMLEKIKILIDDEALFRAMAKRCHESVQSQSSSNLAAELIAVYEELRREKRLSNH